MAYVAGNIIARLSGDKKGSFTIDDGDLTSGKAYIQFYNIDISDCGDLKANDLDDEILRRAKKALREMIDILPD